METLTNNIFSNSIIYSLDTERQTEYDNLLLESVLLLQLSGEMTFETSNDKVTTQPGEIHLVRKNQFIKTTKKPKNNEGYKALMFVLKENVLREYALEKHLESEIKYCGKANIQLPKNDYLKGFFDSLNG